MGTTTYFGHDILDFTDYFVTSKFNLEHASYGIYRNLDRINCAIENQEPISKKQWNHWQRLLRSAEMKCIVVDDMIEHYEIIQATLDKERVNRDYLYFLQNGDESMKVYEIKRRNSYNAFKETSIKLAEAISAAGENERMKGWAYSTFSKLTYKAAGLKYVKPETGSFRQTLNDDDLAKVIQIENKIIEMLVQDMTYDDIKPILLEEL